VLFANRNKAVMWMQLNKGHSELTVKLIV